MTLFLSLWAAGSACALLLLMARYRARRAALEAASTERSSIREPSDEIERTAVHEAGHAILAWVSPYVRKVTELTLEENGEGVTRLQRGELADTVRLWDALAISLAGIAAEGYAFGRVRSGTARRDLERALAWAERLAGTHEDPLSTMPWRPPSSGSRLDIGLMFSERPSHDAHAIMNCAYRHAKDVIALRPEAFRALVELARSRRTLTHEDIEAVLGPRPWAILDR